MLTARPRPRTTPSRSPRHTPAAPPATQAGDPSRLWRAVGLPAQRAAAPRPLFDPAAVAFRDLAGLFVGPHESALAICVDPRPRPTRRAAPQRAAKQAPRPHDRRLALLLEAIDLVVDSASDREAVPPTEAAISAAPLLEFLDRLDRSVAEELEIHLVIDRRASCRLPALREWFRRRPRFHVHFTASHRRWRERALAWLTYAAAVQERQAAPSSALALEAALRRFVLQPPAQPRAFGWARSADEHLTRLARYLLGRERAS
ncbi:MAG: hypothetical protein R3A79_29035 [Nannocystaceae bacterium]